MHANTFAPSNLLQQLAAYGQPILPDLIQCSLITGGALVPMPYHTHHDWQMTQ